MASFFGFLNILHYIKLHVAIFQKQESVLILSEATESQEIGGWL